MTHAMRMPDWIGIGGQRSGTNWLIANLHEHPEICAPTGEVNYFHRDDTYARGPQWYCAHWREARPDQRVGECSSAYLYSAAALQRIRKDCPDARLLVSVRNPVLRTRSAVRLAVMTGRIPPGIPVREAVAQVPQTLEHSRYGKYIERYAEAFSRERIFIAVLDFENPRGFDPDPVLSAVYRFLGVDPAFRSQFARRMIGHAYIPRSIALESALRNTARLLSAAGLDRVRWWVKASGLPQAVRRWNDRTRNTATAHFSRDDMAFLVDALRPDVERLQKLVGVDLEKMWLAPLLDG